MDQRTRSRATAKAASMSSFVGYPVELLDDNKLEKLFANFTIKPNNFLRSMLNVDQIIIKYVLEQLRKPVDKTDWLISDYSTEANAFYDPSANDIPAKACTSKYLMNYGAIGFTIGHECTHGVDNVGRQFAKDGRLVDWWTPATEEKYLEKAQCIINQYNNYTVESVGLNVDGTNTLGENIADNGSIKTAYQAYKEYVKKNGPEAKLPGLKYTPEQLFRISAASVWCCRYGPQSARYELTTDVRSPQRFRVIVSFSNMPEFSNDYHCSVGSLMNPVHKCFIL